MVQGAPALQSLNSNNNNDNDNQEGGEDSRLTTQGVFNLTATLRVPMMPITCVDVEMSCMSF